MNKKLIFVVLSILFANLLFAQKTVSVDINDHIYDIIENAQLRGLCETTPGVKPYSQSKILGILNQILENGEKLTSTELEYINNYIADVNKNEEGQYGSINFENKLGNMDTSLKVYYGLNTAVSGGLYNLSDYNAAGFDFMPNFGFKGNIGEHLGFDIHAIIDVSKMPLHLDGEDYAVGYEWYTLPYENRDATKLRRIKTYSNNAYLPFAYVKPWGGQFYYFSNMSASGLEGWSHELGVTGNILAEIRGSFFDDKFSISAGRVYREWAAMDKRSSLVLNGTAMPFFGVDMTLELLPFVSYSSLTGTLEYPNRDDVLAGSLPSSQDDTQYWQNAFSINMVEVNYKGFHADFGSSVIWPKRFELGYMFPLTNYVEYQNHIGDCDNLGLFGDIKYTYSGLGSVWGSIYLDELNGLNNNPITKTRAMFATQAGIKAYIPNVPFGQLTFRYTRVEPYCYTHQMITNSPYYSDYVATNYINNGISLGSYLPPNSDEFMIRFDAQPTSKIATSVGYQLIRHGADYGDLQVKGSSIYSELDPKRTDVMSKYFLHDGAYNWIHILSLNSSYTSKQTKLPFKVDVTLGGVISYYTSIDSALMNDIAKTEENNAKPGVDFSTPYSFINNETYPFRIGPVLTVNFCLGHF